MTPFYVAMIVVALLVTATAVIIGRKGKKEPPEGPMCTATDGGTENREERNDYGVSLYECPLLGDVKTCRRCHCENRRERKRCVVCGAELSGDHL